jgi:hypothetical protein
MIAPRRVMMLWVVAQEGVNCGGVFDAFEVVAVFVRDK